MSKTGCSAFLRGFVSGTDRAESKVTLFTSLGKRNPETAEKYICVSVFFSSFGVLPRAPSAEADCKKKARRKVCTRLFQWSLQAVP